MSLLEFEMTFGITLCKAVNPLLADEGVLNEVHYSQSFVPD